MKTFCLTLCSLLFFYSFSQGQTLTFSELNSLYQKEHPIGIIELLDGKKFKFYEKIKEEDSVYYYSYTYLDNNYNISKICFVCIDETEDDKISNSYLSVQFQFTKHGKKEYELLVEQINQNCSNHFVKGDSSKSCYYNKEDEKKHSNGMVYSYFITEREGFLYYNISVFFPKPFRTAYCDTSPWE